MKDEPGNDNDDNDDAVHLEVMESERSKTERGLDFREGGTLIIMTCQRLRTNKATRLENPTCDRIAVYRIIPFLSSLHSFVFPQ